MTTKNKLSDLNDHLFAQLERLNDKQLSKEDMDLEIKKAHCVSNVAKVIVANAAVSVQAARLVSEGLLTPEAANDVRNKLLG